MGTNYYIRKARPVEAYPTFHVCKLSAGWNVHFQDSERNNDECAREECPAFHSAADIRNLLSSGEWALADEVGRIWEGDAVPMAEITLAPLTVADREQFISDNQEAFNYGALEEFGRVCSRRGGDLKDCYLGRDYRDPEGFLFSPTEFS